MKISTKRTLSKIDADKAAIIRQKYLDGGVSQNKLAREFGCSQARIWEIVNEKRQARKC